MFVHCSVRGDIHTHIATLSDNVTLRTVGVNLLTISLWHTDSYQFFIISPKKKQNNKRSKEMPYSDEPTYDCSKLIIETLEQGVKYAQS